MATNLSFNPSKFEDLVRYYGIRQAWLNLLATLIHASGTEFTYILANHIFTDSTILPQNLLEKMSIGELSVIYEYCVTHVDSDSRINNGQYFTPDDVANLMVKQTFDFPEGKWLDPCSGIGNLSWHLINAQKDKERFLIKRIVLSDKDDLALIIARTLFTLSFQDKQANLFNEIEECFVTFDFLSVAGSDEGSLFKELTLSAIPVHDFVIVNPPYLSMQGQDQRFETAKSRDLYAYFLENIIKTSKGFVSITPQSFTNAGKFKELRKLLLANYSMLKIYAFDNIPGNIFYGVKFGSTNSNSANSMRAAITVARRGDGGHRISSLLRWRTSERRELFENLDVFLASPKLTAEYFPKVSSVFEDLYNTMLERPRLESIFSTLPTTYVLYVPAAPRYFISALKKSVSRSSMKTLYFPSEREMNRAYLLLNSSFMYWWWRVRDGGMTLSLETLASLPLPEFNLNKKLIAELELSEISNLVYKKNAGALHENVKHDKKLINKLNKWVIPSFSDRLILTHENSELVQIREK